MNDIFVKSKGINSWRDLLANPKCQWKNGYSAKCLAEAWQGADGFPEVIQNVFDKSANKLINNIKFLYGFPEYQVRIPGGNKPSQNDLYVLAQSSGKPVCIMVEGKVNEDFGLRVKDWVEQASNKVDNKRLQYLLDKLNMKGITIDDIRYQLLHRTASALIEAERIGTDQCMVIVHSFSKGNVHFDDFRDFVSLMGGTVEVNAVCGPLKIDSKDVFYLWAN